MNARITLLAFALSLGILLAAFPARAQTCNLYGATSFSVSPAIPRAGEDFVLAATWYLFYNSEPTSPFTASVVGRGTLQLSRSFVSKDPASSIFGSTRVMRIDMPGTYTVMGTTDYQGFSLCSYPPKNLGTLTIAPATGDATPARRDLSGLWWDPQESGWGLSLTQGESGQLFALVFTYRPAAGRMPILAIPPSANYWLGMSDGHWISSTEFRGLLFDTKGPALNESFTTVSVQTSVLGSLTIKLLADGRLEFFAESLGDGIDYRYTIRKTLQKFQF